MTLKHLFTTTLITALCMVGTSQAAICENNLPATNPDDIYEVNNDGTVTDTRTGLMWKQCLEGYTGASCDQPDTDPIHEFSWADALLHASTSTFAGHNDWRVPNVKELQSLVELCRVYPSINTNIFPTTELPPLVWTSSPSFVYSSTTDAWGVEFGTGHPYPNTMRSNQATVRLVRGGQAFAPFISLPTLSDVAVSGMPTATEATVAATSDQTATGYWLAVPKDSVPPTAEQVKDPNANGYSIQPAAQGSAAMIAYVATSFTVTGLNAATAYDFYVVAEASGQLSELAGPVQFTTGSAAPIAGVCGTANGGFFTSAPTTNLCTTGEATEVTGPGPWSWVCNGQYGSATNGSCSANLLYTKIANNGSELFADATLGTDPSDWACTRDNSTGLIWEVKTTSGLRSQDHTYSWYDSNSSDGNPGTSSGGTCATSGRCDTEKYTEDVNAVGLCGATDWRMPDRDELMGIVDDESQTSPRIDLNFFPNTRSSETWSSLLEENNWNPSAWGIYFQYGLFGTFPRSYASSVRLVRAGQSLAPVLSNLSVQDITHNSATVQATSNLAGTGYWLVLPSGNTPPTPAQIKAHANAQSLAMAAATPASDTLTGLSANTAYDLYFTAHDPDSGQLSAPAQMVTFTTAVTPVASVCGSAHDTGTTALLTSAPTANLCVEGTPSTVTEGTSTWNWTCGGSTPASCQAPRGYTITASAAQGGTATCNNSAVAYGSSAICTATAANAGYQFSAWTGACEGQGSTCTLVNVAADQASEALFKQATLTLPLQEGPQAKQLLSITQPTENNWIISIAGTIKTSSVGTPPPANVTLPHGLVILRLINGDEGSDATVVLTYPEAFPEGTVYYKYGKTLENQTDHWYEFSGAVISGNTITLTLTDGGAGDSDLEANSVIDDPGGPAVPAAPVPAEVTPVPTLGQWALLLLAGLLGALGLQRMRTSKAG